MIEEKLLFSREAAAKATDLSVRAIDYAVETGELEAVRIGKRVMIPRESLIAFCRRGCARIRPAADPATARG